MRAQTKLRLPREKLPMPSCREGCNGGWLQHVYSIAADNSTSQVGKTFNLHSKVRARNVRRNISLTLCPIHFSGSWDKPINMPCRISHPLP